MRVLVTGAAGFAARHLVPELAAHGHAVTASDVVDTPAGAAAAVKRADLTDRAAVDALVETAAPEACVHLGAIAFVPEGEQHPGRMTRVNFEGTLNLLDAFASHAPDARILVVSTAHVYGNRGGPEAIAEEAPLLPATRYAATKAAADVAALGAAAARGAPVMTARPANHTGPGQPPRFVVPALAAQVRAVADGRTAAVLRVGNLDSEREFCDVRDVVRAYRLLLERGTPGRAYNIGSGRRVPIRSILEKLCAAAGLDPRVEVDPDLYRPTDRSPLLNSARIRSETGWSAAIELEQTLGDVLHGVET